MARVIDVQDDDIVINVVTSIPEHLTYAQAQALTYAQVEQLVYREIYGDF